jgi:hypothetical protein
MSEWWDEDTVFRFEMRLQDRFPRHWKTIFNIITFAGEAANAHSCTEDNRYPNEERFEHRYDKVMRMIKRLPWKV